MPKSDMNMLFWQIFAAVMCVVYSRHHEHKYSDCSRGFKEFEQYCLKTYHYATDYETANRKCHHYESHLIRGTKEELEDMFDKMQKKGMIENVKYWTGSYEFDENSVWYHRFDPKDFAMVMSVDEDDIEERVERRSLINKFICQKYPGSGKTHLKYFLKAWSKTEPNHDKPGSDSKHLILEEAKTKEWQEKESAQKVQEIIEQELGVQEQKLEQADTNTEEIKKILIEGVEEIVPEENENSQQILEDNELGSQQRLDDNELSSQQNLEENQKESLTDSEASELSSEQSSEESELSSQQSSEESELSSQQSSEESELSSEMSSQASELSSQASEEASEMSSQASEEFDESWEVVLSEEEFEGEPEEELEEQLSEEQSSVHGHEKYSSATASSVAGYLLLMANMLLYIVN